MSDTKPVESISFTLLAGGFIDWSHDHYYQRRSLTQPPVRVTARRRIVR